MSYSIRWGGDPEDVALTVSGPADDLEIVAALREIRSAPEFRPRLRVLIDERKVDWSQVTGKDIRRRAATLLAEELPEERHLVAVVVEAPLAFGLIRMLHGNTESESSSLGRVFYDVESARAWLAQSPD